MSETPSNARPPRHQAPSDSGQRADGGGDGAAQQRVFVYGTLRRGAMQDCGGVDGAFPPFEPLRRASAGGMPHPAREVLSRLGRYLGDGVCHGRLYKVSWYPGLVEAEDDGRGHLVRGEVYELIDPARVLPVLDAYEGCSATDPEPHEYRRVLRTIEMDDGRAVPAWVYLYQGEVDEACRIDSGDYTDGP